MADEPTNENKSNETDTATPAAEAPAAHVVQAEPDKIEPEIKADETPASDEPSQGAALFDIHKLDILNDLYVALTIEVGRAQIKIRDLLSLNKGSIIELNKLAGEPVDVYANGKLISTGSIITANGKYCVRLTSISDSHKKEMEKNGK